MREREGLRRPVTGRNVNSHRPITWICIKNNNLLINITILNRKRRYIFATLTKIFEFPYGLDEEYELHLYFVLNQSLRQGALILLALVAGHAGLHLSFFALPVQNQHIHD